MSNDPELGGDKRKVAVNSTGDEPGLSLKMYLVEQLAGALVVACEHGGGFNGIDFVDVALEIAQRGEEAVGLACEMAIDRVQDIDPMEDEWSMIAVIYLFSGVRRLVRSCDDNKGLKLTVMEQIAEVQSRCGPAGFRSAVRAVAISSIRDMVVSDDRVLCEQDTGVLMMAVATLGQDAYERLRGDTYASGVRVLQTIEQQSGDESVRVAARAQLVRIGERWNDGYGGF